MEVLTQSHHLDILYIVVWMSRYLLDNWLQAITQGCVRETTYLIVEAASNILHEYQYIIAFGWTNFRSTFSTPIEVYFQNALFEPLFQASKNVDLAIYFKSAGIQRNDWVPINQDSTTDDSTSQFWMLFLFELICESLSCWSNGTVPTYPVISKKETTIFFEVFHA